MISPFLVIGHRHSGLPFTIAYTDSLTEAKEDARSALDSKDFERVEIWDSKGSKPIETLQEQSHKIEDDKRSHLD